ncbi:MAG: S-layer homology domain-containing protein [Halanaerobiales bacterium]|nr:S-layer homology domain-containing protein [Halanaerobiales bacterium]
MRKFTIVIALLLVVALATPALGASFPDVPSNHWAYEAINKLVAAGVIEGYPDGTYKGQNNLTRYEMAMMISRALDNINEQQAEMLERIDSMGEEKAGLTTEQAQDVTAIVKALIQKNMPEQTEQVEFPENLTEEQINEVANLIEALTFEYRAELKVLGSDIEGLQMDMDEVEARVAALENATPVISFSGLYSVDFSNVAIEGDGIVPDDELDAEAVFNYGTTPYTANEYFFEDPYSVSSGYYLVQSDSATNNEFDLSPDFRIADGGDYYTEGTSFTNSLDLNVVLNKGALSADLDLSASTNVFGAADTNGFELNDLSGTITTPDFTATIADGQSVTFKDYLFDASHVADGVVVNSDNHTFFLSRTLEEELVDYTDIVWGAQDNYDYYERSYLRAGANMNFDLMLPVNVFYGYEYSADGVFDLYNSVDGITTAGTLAVSEVRDAVLGLATGTEFGGMNVTADFATNLYDGQMDDYLFMLGATGEFDMFNLAFNYAKNNNFTALRGTTPLSGYDVEVGATLGMVEGSVYYEDYGTALTTLKAAVPEGELSFGGIAVDGSYELTTNDLNAHDEYRQINVSTTMAGFDLSYMYDYNADNEIWDPEVDMLDDGQNSIGDYWYEAEDADLNLHTLAAGYALTDSIDLGFTSEFEKAIANDATDIVWANEFVNTNTFTADYASGPITAGLVYVMDGATTITGRYTADMFEAGFSKVLDGDLVIDGKVMSPVYNLWGVDVSGGAMMKRNIDTTAQDVGVWVDMSKEVNERLALNAGLEYGDKEIDVDYAGVKIAAKAGAEYSVTEDISATANYEYLNWTGDSYGDFTAQKATAGVSVAF